MAAIVSGAICIQPPGYFLFGEIARLIVLASNCSPAVAISIINVTLSTLGVMVFANLAIRIFSGILGVLLSAFYAFSATVWFVADVHSTYAAMTFFAPALIYSMWVEENWWLSGLLWAAMTGFRPSDGVFVIPFIVFVLWRRSRREIVAFACAAIPVLALWYIPTVGHFGGHLLSPLSAAGDQVGSLANGLLIPGLPWKRKIGNVVHLAFGVFNAWNILAPFLFIGIFSKQPWSRYALSWMAPGFLFFLLYFFSDTAYLAYMIAPGVLLAGEGLNRIRPRAAALVAFAGLLISVAQITLLRPIMPKTVGQAIVNAYFLQYSGWAIKHRCEMRLKSELEALHTLEIDASNDGAPCEAESTT